MNAVEFVKQFGWDLVESDVACLESGFITKADFLEHYGFEILDELKCLVELKNLVESGLRDLKEEMFSNDKDLDYVKNWLINVSDKTLTKKGLELKLAVLEIEQCK